MVFGAVAQNGGRIEVYSEIGHGTTFKVYLPCVAESSPSGVVPPPAAARGGDESILVVEDDDAVRAFAVRVLRGRGYRVHAFRTGAAALKALDGLPPLHMLVTDVVMPDMNGRTTADRVLERRPGVRVLFVSGYTEHVIAHRGVLAPGIEFLAKPYSVDSLTRRVRELLDRR
jgi:CheY-like chemotaxis protein